MQECFNIIKPIVLIGHWNILTENNMATSENAKKLLNSISIHDKANSKLGIKIV
jgi:hypothetical protein